MLNFNLGHDPFSDIDLSLNNHDLRQLIFPYIFDKTVGDFVNCESGEVLSYAEVSEIFRLRNPEEGTLPGSSLETSMQEILIILDELKFMVSHGCILRSPYYPEMVIGETDLVQGAGSENRIYPATFDAIELDRHPETGRLIQSIQYLLVRLGRDWKNNFKENRPLLRELATIIEMYSIGIVPLSSTSRVLRIGEGYKRIFEKALLSENQLGSAMGLVKDLQSEIQKLQNDKRALLGDLKKTKKDFFQVLEEVDFLARKHPMAFNRREFDATGNLIPFPDLLARYGEKSLIRKHLQRKPR